MSDDLFTDEPIPSPGGGLFTDAPAPEKGLYGQTIEKNPDETPFGWDIKAGKPRTEPTREQRESIYQEPGIQDATVNDTLAAQGAYGLGKLGLGMAGKAAGSVLEDVLPALSKVPTIGKVIPNTENLVPSVERIANNQTLKSMGGTMGQLNQMAKGREGRVALDKAAKYARDKGLADVFSTSIGRDKNLEALLDSEGALSGALRKEAGNAQQGIPEKIAEQLKKKYGPDALRSSEGPAVEKALKTVREFGGGKPPMVQELPIVDPKTITGEPKALFAYNQPDLSGRGAKEVSMYKVLGDHPSSGSQMTFSQLKEAGIPVVGREARSAGKWEPLDLASPEIPPTHAGYANAATELNEYAAGNKLYQPVTAETDVANALSRENNAGIVQSLGPDKGKQYLQSLENQQRLHPLQHLQERGELREVGGRGGQGIGKAFIQKLADSFGYRMTAKKAAAMHDLLTGADLPETASQAVRGAPKMVPAALNDFLSQKYSKKELQK